MSTLTSPAPAPVRHRGRRRLGGRRVWLIAGLVVLLLIAALAWLGYGLLSAAKGIKADAAAAQSSLQVFKTKLSSGDQTGAEQALASAKRSVERADARSDAAQVRLAGHLPVASIAVSDLRHLLAAAGIVVDTAGDASDLYGQFAGEHSTLFHDGTFNLTVLATVSKDADRIDQQLGVAEADLKAVKGTVPGTHAVLAARDSALAQVQDLRGQIVALRPALQAAPGFLGADGPRTYLVSLLNPAEMRPSGGAPLSVALVRVDHGAIKITQRGTSSRLTNMNQIATYDHVPHDLWSGPDRFVNANFNPDFRISGAEMSRAWRANTGTRTQGVIALDTVALQALMRATGPISTPGYGTVTADNLQQKLLVSAYSQFGQEQDERQDLNVQLMDVMVAKLFSGGHLLGKAKALATAVPGRHVQVWMADPAEEKLLADHGLTGAVADTVPGDLLSTWALNQNASKVDVFQHRAIDVKVRLAPDGGAKVTQTIRVTNAAPGPLSPDDPKLGYTTRYLVTEVSAHVPASATHVQVDGPGSIRKTKIFTEANGMIAVQRPEVGLSPGETDTVVISYQLPKGTFGTGSNLDYRLLVEPSNLLNTPTATVRVQAPAGWHAAAATGWTAKGSTATWSGKLDAITDTSVRVSR